MTRTVHLEDGRTLTGQAAADYFHAERVSQTAAELIREVHALRELCAAMAQRLTGLPPAEAIERLTGSRHIAAAVVELPPVTVTGGSPEAEGYARARQDEADRQRWAEARDRAMWARDVRHDPRIVRALVHDEDPADALADLGHVRAAELVRSGLSPVEAVERAELERRSVRTEPGVRRPGLARELAAEANPMRRADALAARAAMGVRTDPQTGAPVQVSRPYPRAAIDGGELDEARERERLIL